MAAAAAELVKNVWSCNFSSLFGVGRKCMVV